ncbi:MAG TPA: hypothetical protein VJQ08_00200 [Candidatus Dormibacteraeota bacterium]|nr:hypothetical protein [Candidatus Dormibacteraeota bacterium]
MATEFADTATAVEEVAVGAVKSAAEVASDPIRSARKQVKSFERKGAPVVRRINRRLTSMIPEKVTVLGLDINGRLPERLAIKGLHAVKAQAKRQDPVGGIATRALRTFNVSFRTIARTATRLEQASALTLAPKAQVKTARRTVRRRAA